MSHLTSQDSILAALFPRRRKKTEVACIHCRKRKCVQLYEYSLQECERCVRKGLSCEYVIRGTSNAIVSGPEGPTALDSWTLSDTTQSPCQLIGQMDQNNRIPGDATSSSWADMSNTNSVRLSLPPCDTPRNQEQGYLLGPSPTTSSAYTSYNHRAIISQPFFGPRPHHHANQTPQHKPTTSNSHDQYMGSSSSNETTSGITKTGCKWWPGNWYHLKRVKAVDPNDTKFDGLQEPPKIVRDVPHSARRGVLYAAGYWAT
ncbi:hypothetical protein DFH07DRAFT_779334 [Mycena maculata]|uniref:Zn(2)-C6 fungal-type domain-containing protein n=1 Tax=Mycena maculata TaxID=230809 RepID=A0AAD7I8F4_9AGAR|nr:hypothetical protein DFH07DRAFT_779334 [Mycena maculata]